MKKIIESEIRTCDLCGIDDNDEPIEDYDNTIYDVQIREQKQSQICMECIRKIKKFIKKEKI